MDAEIVLGQRQVDRKGKWPIQNLLLITPAVVERARTVALKLRQYSDESRHKILPILCKAAHRLNPDQSCFFAKL